MKKISLVVKKPGCVLEKICIENELKSFQLIVGGMIEGIYLSSELNDKDICCYGNEEGKIYQLPPNFWIANKRDFVCGNVVFFKTDDEGEETSLEDEDIKMIEIYLENNHF